MPRRLFTVHRRLGEKAHVPQRDVRPNQLRHHVEDLGVTGVVQKPHVEAQQIRAIVAKLGMAGKQAVVIGAISASVLAAV